MTTQIKVKITIDGQKKSQSFSFQNLGVTGRGAKWMQKMFPVNAIFDKTATVAGLEAGNGTVSVLSGGVLGDIYPITDAATTTVVETPKEPVVETTKEFVEATEIEANTPITIGASSSVPESDIMPLAQLEAELEAEANFDAPEESPNVIVDTTQRQLEEELAENTLTAVAVSTKMTRSQLKAMKRTELEELAKSNSIDPTGKNVDTLRKVLAAIVC